MSRSADITTVPGTGTAAPIVSCRDVVVELGGRTVVDQVSVEVAPGGWLGLIGPNGAGKTTLLLALAGLRPRTSGTVEVAGIDPQSARRRTIARHVAVVAQRPVLPTGMPVFDYVLLGRTSHLSALRTESRRDMDIVGDVLDDLDLDHLAGRNVDQLSGGESQRVALARAIAQQAPVLLLDEPTSALDVGHQQDVLELVDRLRRERSLAVIAAMHDLTAAGQFADALTLLDQGRAVANGRVADVLDETTIASHYRATVRIVTGDDGTIAVIPRRPARPADAELVAAQAADAGLDDMDGGDEVAS